MVVRGELALFFKFHEEGGMLVQCAGRKVVQGGPWSRVDQTHIEFIKMFSLSV